MSEFFSTLFRKQPKNWNNDKKNAKKPVQQPENGEKVGDCDKIDLNFYMFSWLWAKLLCNLRLYVKWHFCSFMNFRRRSFSKFDLLMYLSTTYVQAFEGFSQLDYLSIQS